VRAGSRRGTAAARRGSRRTRARRGGVRTAPNTAAHAPRRNCRTRCFFRSAVTESLSSSVLSTSSRKDGVRSPTGEHTATIVDLGERALGGGPAMTEPSGSKREPWHGQSHVRSASFQSTVAAHMRADRGALRQVPRAFAIDGDALSVLIDHLTLHHAEPCASSAPRPRQLDPESGSTGSPCSP